MAEVIAVQPQQTLDGLLAEIGSRLESMADGTLLLWAPRGTLLLRQMEDYQALRKALREGGPRLKILSPDARIVGMALVFGLEAEITLHAPEPSTSAPPPTPAAAGPPAPAPGPRSLPPAAAPTASEAAGRSNGTAGAAAGQPGNKPGRLRNPALPPRARPSGMIILPDTAPGPAHETVDLSKLPDPLNLAQQTVALNTLHWDLSAPHPGNSPLQADLGGPGAPVPDAISNWLHHEEDDAPAISFAQWLAMQKAGPSGGPPADLDLSHLPPWLQATLTPPPPTTPPAPAPPAVLRCPHCGAELDKEEMLRLLAELWGR